MRTSHNRFIDDVVDEVRGGLRAYAQRIDRVLDRLEAAASSLEHAAGQIEAASRPVTETAQVADSGSWFSRLIGRA
jgi:methyl-accepting chemotaxis protein